MGLFAVFDTYLERDTFCLTRLQTYRYNMKQKGRGDMYLLMNKDKEIMRFDVIEGTLGNSYKVISQNKDMLPYGFQSINSWIGSRKGSKHNTHIREIMKDCGCEDDLGYIRVTHAASLNDTYWIKNETENINWVDVSFYRNEFNEQISRLAFEGVGLYGIQLSSTSPELCTEGSFRKCWRRENGEIYLYKRGSSCASNAGLEPYCEMLASELAVHVCDNAVPYKKVLLHGELASKCHLFTNEMRGYVPYARISEDNTANAMLDFYSSIGSEDAFRQMLVLDALTFNVDRHAGNHGVFVENDTKQILKMAPVFDMNMSLLPYLIEPEFTEIGNKMQQYGPRIGDDFTRIGQMAMTSSLRTKLINLKGFQFSFRGDDKFSPERVQLLERMIEKQIEALLSKEILYTRDVFVPEKTEQILEQRSETKQSETKENELVAYLKEAFPGQDVSEMYDEDNNAFAVVNISSETDVYVSCDDFSVWVYEDDILVDEPNESDYEQYQKICESVDNYVFENIEQNGYNID